MSDTRFVQFHFLTSYPSALLNRDDVGFAKRIPFGGAIRTRISSQCLKRHWRTFEGPMSLRELQDVEPSIRSRQTFERFLYRPLLEAGISDDMARGVTEALMREVLGESPKRVAKEKTKDKQKESDKSEKADEVATGQVTVLGKPEMAFLVAEGKAIAEHAGDPKGIAKAMKDHFTRERRENLRELRRGAGLDAAVFGRMVTSDVLARCDAAVHVAHAFTVHAEESETDYFSAVDDLLRERDEGALGSGHIGTTELTSGIYYGYAVADVPLLVSNLGADRAMAADVLWRLAHLIATVSPGAKLGSTAPHSYATFVLAEAGRAQPRTLANSFLRPVSARGDLLGSAYDALAGHLADLDEAYGRNRRRALVMGPKERFDSVVPTDERSRSLGELASWVREQIAEGG